MAVLCFVLWRSRRQRRDATSFPRNSDAESPVSVNAIEPESMIPRIRQLESMRDAGADAVQKRSPGSSGYYAVVEHRLEQAFAQYQQSRISLDSFEVVILAEWNAALRRIAVLQARRSWAKRSSGEPDERKIEADLNDTQDAFITAKWCLSWVEQARAQLQAGHESANSLD